MEKKQQRSRQLVSEIKPGSRILISGCLVGLNCNYKGLPSSDYLERALFWKQVLKDFICFPVCPEQLGGLMTPRVPAELQGTAAEVLSGHAAVVNKVGEDVSAQFIAGAREAEKLAALLQVDFAVLKSRSPSCGKGKVYDGTFSGHLVAGSGLSAELLERSGIRVFCEGEFFRMLDVQIGSSL